MNNSILTPELDRYFRKISGMTEIPSQLPRTEEHQQLLEEINRTVDRLKSLVAQRIDLLNNELREIGCNKCFWIADNTSIKFVVSYSCEIHGNQ